MKFHVVVTYGGSPVEDVAVSVDFGFAAFQAELTDAEGHCSFTLPDSGKHQIRASPERGPQVVFEIDDLLAGETLRIDLERGLVGRTTP